MLLKNLKVVFWNVQKHLICMLLPISKLMNKQKHLSNTFSNSLGIFMNVYTFSRLSVYLSSSSSINLPEKTSAMTYFINDNSEIKLQIMFRWLLGRPNRKANRKTNRNICFHRDLTWKTMLAVICIAKSPFFRDPDQNQEQFFLFTI